MRRSVLRRINKCSSLVVPSLWSDHDDTDDTCYPTIVLAIRAISCGLDGEKVHLSKGCVKNRHINFSAVWYSMDQHADLDFSRFQNLYDQAKVDINVSNRTVRLSWPFTMVHTGDRWNFDILMPVLKYARDVKLNPIDRTITTLIGFSDIDRNRLREQETVSVPTSYQGCSIAIYKGLLERNAKEKRNILVEMMRHLEGF